MCARAAKAWKDAGLAPIGLQEARHTCASIFSAAGVNVKAVRLPRARQHHGHPRPVRAPDAG